MCSYEKHLAQASKAIKKGHLFLWGYFHHHVLTAGVLIMPRTTAHMGCSLQNAVSVEAKTIL